MCPRYLSPFHFQLPPLKHRQRLSNTLNTRVTEKNADTHTHIPTAYTLHTTSVLFVCRQRCGRLITSIICMNVRKRMVFRNQQTRSRLWQTSARTVLCSAAFLIRWGGPTTPGYWPCLRTWLKRTPGLACSSNSKYSKHCVLTSRQCTRHIAPRSAHNCHLTVL
jgi:hypothetical protein